MAGPAGWKMWWLGIRPRTLTMAVAPVLAASAEAWHRTGGVKPLPVLACLAGALAIQSGTNLWNDAADGERGGDRAGRLGPPRLTAMGWAMPGQVRRAALAAFAVAALSGLYLAWLGGWPIILLGLASLAAGAAYSLGPLPLSHTPLGEVFVIAFFGLGAVGGTLWVQDLAPDAGIISLGLALGLPAAAVLMVNNHRDRVADFNSGRRTLAILLGPRLSLAAYGVLVSGPFLLLPPGLPLLALPVALYLLWHFWLGRDFNLLLARTAQYQLLLAALSVP